jgi:hypothetical protein
MTWYNTGTVTVTPGSNAVIGVGTAFIRNARVGDGFRGPDGGWYEITNIASDTALSITPAYGAPSAYAVAPLQGYVKDSADALREATRTIAGGIADMQDQVAAATEAAESAGHSKVTATEQASIATDAAALSTGNKDAAQQAAEQSQSSAGASNAAAVRAESARDSIVQSEQAAADSAEAAAQSADRAEQATAGKANKGANNDITSLSGLTTPLSVAQGGNGAVTAQAVTNANAPLNNGRYSTPSSGWTGQVFPGTDARNDGYLTHDNYGAGYAVQSWRSIFSDVPQRSRWKFDGTWGAWAESTSGGTGLPVGSVMPWNATSRSGIPAGWIARDGQLLNRADWPELWNLVSSTAITDAAWLAAPYTSRGAYSQGNGTTTFRMPDTNGKASDGLTISSMVLRGDGKNSGGVYGIHQADQVQGMKHRTVSGNSISGGTNLNAAFTTEVASTPSLAAIAAVQAAYSVSTGGAISDGVNGAPRVGTETRSANETVIWCTVGAGKAVNPGTVDVTALATNVSNQSSQIAAVDASTGFAMVFPNGGSPSSPANIAVNQRYVVSNPFPGYHVLLKVELLVNGVWSDPSFDGNAGSGGNSYGTKANQFFGTGDIAVQTAVNAVMLGTSAATGGGHGATGGALLSTAPCRLKVWKIKGVAA